jgi:hypothetical protein
MHIPSNLVDAVKQRQVVLFAGAGMSFPALGILGRHVRDTVGADIRRDFPDYEPAERSFEDVCDEYAVLNDRQALVNRLAGLIDQTAKPTASHIAAVSAFRFIVTTNWDLLFEAAYRHIGQHYQVLSSEGDVPNFDYDQHNLLKIHGSADRPLTLVTTSEDYESYPDTHAGFLDRLTQLLHNNTVLFVGYALRDEHLRRLLTRIRRQRQAWARRAYAVGFFDDVRKRLLGSRKIEVIDIPRPTDTLASGLEDFMPELIRQAGINVPAPPP